MPVITNKIRRPNHLPIMAKALGVNFEQALLSNGINNLQRHNAANKCSECSECSEKNACMAWLAVHDAGAVKAPDYCPNKELLEKLRN